MKHIKHTLLIALFSMANFVAAADSFEPQIIKGRIIEKGTGMPVPNCSLWVSYFRDAGREVHISSVAYGCSDNGEFAITNLSDQISRCDIELRDGNKYQEPSIISGPFEPGINDWGTIEVSRRPFYFESCCQRSNLVSATIFNTMNKPMYMRFWLTGKLTRLDDSEYLGCSSEVLLELRRNKKELMNYATYRLVPGKNNIELNVKDYGSDISVSSIMINGGRSYSEPMMPSSFVFQIRTLPPIWITNSIPVLTTNLPPIRITNFPPIITNLPPPVLITNLPPIRITNFPPRPLPTNLPPYTTLSGVQVSFPTSRRP